MPATTTAARSSGAAARPPHTGSPATLITAPPGPGVRAPFALVVRVRRRAERRSPERTHAPLRAPLRQIPRAERPHARDAPAHVHHHRRQVGAGDLGLQEV